MKRSIIWKILVYFIVYSVIGFLMETFYAIATEGILESRKSFIYGPFCIVYGLAAIVLIFSLNKYKTNKLKLFIYGMILGAIIEYYSSYLGEVFLHVKWWDYSNSFLNIHGRTCLYYAIMWGILSVILIDYFNPKVDKIINFTLSKISIKYCKTIIILITAFMIFDGIISSIAIQNFIFRVSNNYSINIKGVNSKSIASIYFENKFPDCKMIMTYPNIIVIDEGGNNIYLGSVLSDLQTYYYKLGNK